MNRPLGIYVEGPGCSRGRRGQFARDLAALAAPKAPPGPLTSVPGRPLPWDRGHSCLESPCSVWIFNFSALGANLCPTGAWWGDEQKETRLLSVVGFVFSVQFLSYYNLDYETKL